MRAALAVIALLPFSAHAWESVCYEPGGKPCAPASGPNTARNRWVGPLDEHRQLFGLSSDAAGLPAALGEAQVLQVFTGSQSLMLNGRAVTTWRPAPFALSTRSHTRTVTASELAQLPDFSFGLWDWADGHETCPIADGTDATLCHDFASHMGPVNSNHFVPQAARSYASYHSLAVSRAAECKALSLRLASSGARFTEVLRACEKEALSLEAIGQHFLQDAWSMGHMWERWGSTDLSDFPGATVVEKRDRAVLVALVSGFMHGARGVLQSIPEWTSYDVNDAMCAPWPTVRFKNASGAFSQGVGDDYAALLFPPTAKTAFTEQQTRFLDCSTSGLLEVYEQTSMAHGATVAPASGLTRVDPTSAVCFGQRATNEAMVEGMAIQLKAVGLQTSIPLDARFTSWLIPQVARSAGKTPVDRKLRNEFRFSMQRVVTMARLKAKLTPQGTQLANGGMGDLLGVAPNGKSNAASPFEEPALPWSELTARSASLARVFHLAHAADWCSTVDLAALKAHVSEPSLDAEGKLAACGVCTEMAGRSLRIGAAGSYEVDAEPLCHYLTGSPSYVYQRRGSHSTPRQVAQAWCGCQ